MHLATPSQEFNREEAEKQRRMMEGSPPTPRYTLIPLKVRYAFTSAHIKQIMTTDNFISTNATSICFLLTTFSSLY